MKFSIHPNMYIYMYLSVYLSIHLSEWLNFLPEDKQTQRFNTDQDLLETKGNSGKFFQF